MTIKAGDRIPDGKLKVMGADGPANRVEIAEQEIERYLVGRHRLRTAAAARIVGDDPPSIGKRVQRRPMIEGEGRQHDLAAAPGDAVMEPDPVRSDGRTLGDRHRRRASDGNRSCRARFRIGGAAGGRQGKQHDQERENLHPSHRILGRQM